MLYSHTSQGLFFSLQLDVVLFLPVHCNVSVFLHISLGLAEIISLLKQLPLRNDLPVVEIFRSRVYREVHPVLSPFKTETILWRWGFRAWLEKQLSCVKGTIIGGQSGTC